MNLWAISCLILQVGRCFRAHPPPNAGTPPLQGPITPFLNSGLQLRVIACRMLDKAAPQRTPPCHAALSRTRILSWFSMLHAE